MFKSIGFIGGGRITRIILGGFDRIEKWPGKVIVSDTNADVLKDLQKRFPKIEVGRRRSLRNPLPPMWSSLPSIPRRSWEFWAK